MHGQFQIFIPNTRVRMGFKVKNLSPTRIRRQKKKKKKKKKIGRACLERSHGQGRGFGGPQSNRSYWHALSNSNNSTAVWMSHATFLAAVSKHLPMKFVVKSLDQHYTVYLWPLLWEMFVTSSSKFRYSVSVVYLMKSLWSLRELVWKFREVLLLIFKNGHSYIYNFLCAYTEQLLHFCIYPFGKSLWSVFH